MGWGGGNVSSGGLDALLGSTRGMVPYRNATVWTGLAIGADGTILASDGTDPVYRTFADLADNVLTTRGDLLVNNGTTAVRLALGATGTLLRSDGTDAAWATVATSLLSVLTTSGDLVYNNSGTITRLAIGANGTILHSSGAVPQWVSTITGPIEIANLGVGPNFKVDNKLTGGTLVSFSHDTAVTLDGTTIGLDIDLNTNVTGGSQTATGLQIKLPTAAGSGADGILIYTFAPIANAIDIRTRSEQSNIFNISYDTGTTLAAALTGINLDLTSSVTHNAQVITGLSISTAATTAANANAQGAIVVNSDGTAARLLDLDGANTSGTLAAIRATSATHSGTLTGLHLDLDQMGAAAQILTGIDLDLGPSSSASSIGIDIDSTQTGAASSGIDINMAPGSSADVRAITVNSGANCSLYGILCSYSGPNIGIRSEIPAGNTNANTIALNGACITTTAQAAVVPALASSLVINRGVVANPATTTFTGTESAGIALIGRYLSSASGANTISGHVLILNNIPNTAGAATLTLSGNILFVNHAPAASGGGITDTTVGIKVSMAPASSAATPAIDVAVGANVSAAGAVLTSTNASTAYVPFIRAGAPSSATGTQFTVGSGAPAHTTSVNNGDFYFRTDGAAGTMIYARIGGVWTALC